MIGNVMWILAMVGLILSVVVVAVRENSAQNKARKAMANQPQPLDLDQSFDDSNSDGFGEPDPVDSFGTDDDFASFNEKSLK